MKPIKLKLKGLNSFIDGQEVDFERLTDKGLFGIFGPTGSGKSTILDGITLALYGEISRKSSNYINTNCDSLNVSFEFQISHNETKCYRVERVFKRERKTGNVRTRSAKIIEITNSEETLLEEGAKPVTQRCEEIIGLELEDFTRTVVLPQGKFSEFLKLEGKDRRSMLERLFNLQKYGDDLSNKLASKIREEKDKANVLMGQLKGFVDISKEALEEKNKLLAVLNDEFNKQQEELRIVEEKYNEAKELWDLQRELKEEFLKLEDIKGQEADMDNYQERVKLGEGALKVKPYIDGYENTLEEIKSADIQLETLKTEMKDIQVRKDRIYDSLSAARNRKDSELPKLRVEEERTRAAIEEKSKLDNLINDNKNLYSRIETLENNLKEASNRITENDYSISKLETSITEGERKIESLKVSEAYKNRVNKGFLLINSLASLTKQKNSLNSSIESALGNIKGATEKSNGLSSLLKERDQQIVENRNTLEILIAASPGDQNTLLSLQAELAGLKDVWNRFNQINDELSKSIKAMSEFQPQVSLLMEERAKIEGEIYDLRLTIKVLETENIANTLRVELREGELCPVCGSRDHPTENLPIHSYIDVSKLQSDLEAKEGKVKLLTEEIVELQTNIKTHQGIIADREGKLQELGEDFKTTTVEALEAQLKDLGKAINEFNEGKVRLEGSITGLTKERSDIEVKLASETAIINHNSSALIGFQNDLKGIDEDIVDINSKLVTLKEELAIEDFILIRDEINKKEEEKSDIEAEIKELRNSLKVKHEARALLAKEEGDLRNHLAEDKSAYSERSKSIVEKEKSIRDKVGNVEDLEALLEGILKAIEKIEEEYKQAEEQKDKIELQFTECNNGILSTQGNLASLRKKNKDDKDNLDKALAEEAIGTIEEAKNNYMSKAEIDRLKDNIEAYRESLNKVTGRIEALTRKINNRSLTEEEWIEIQAVKAEGAQILKDLDENKIKLKEEIKTVGDKLIQFNKLLKDKEELDYKLGLLDDLEKLFRGKRFVEYVAANQLKYVSIEASKWLKEITGGNYGLEVDENARFIIRDYKNGGAQRDASTLSGGETFVTSLALALALSSQIQLKGTAPLELFFLDEGFGTLDDNLLEVVMDSLEKIHNDKLSIGIISHVESIKSRVPVKLIVTPAEAGVGGSRVKLERS